MKNILLFIVCLSSFSVYSQEAQSGFDGHKWEAPYHLSIPKDWTIERFLIPIVFAPEIPYKGVEDIRFTPGWGNVNTDDYWSYAFMWYLDGSPQINSATISANLKAYYTGLLKINTDSSKLAAIPQTLKTVKTAFKATSTQKGEEATYIGTIEMMDYMQLKRIILNSIVHVKFCPEEKKTIVFHELSPKPFSHNVWTGLNKLWLDFNCKR
jgi:hypothetical protein